MRIDLRVGTRALAGELTYVRSDASFLFLPAQRAELEERAAGGVWAAQIGTLQVAVSVLRNEALYADGLHATALWADRVCGVPNAPEGAAFLRPPTAIGSGIGVSIAGVAQWRTVFDASTGWVRVGEDEDPDDMAVMIASGVVLGSKDGHLHSLWLRPRFVPQ
jgi:hypothetical protein